MDFREKLLSFLKTAHYITGDKKYLRPYALPARKVRRRRKAPTIESARPEQESSQEQARVVEENLPTNGRTRSLPPETPPPTSVEKP